MNRVRIRSDPPQPPTALSVDVVLHHPHPTAKARRRKRHLPRRLGCGAQDRRRDETTRRYVQRVLTHYYEYREAELKGAKVATR